LICLCNRSKTSGAVLRSSKELSPSLPGSLVVRIRRSHRRGPGSIPGQGSSFFFSLTLSQLSYFGYREPPLVSQRDELAKATPLAFVRHVDNLVAPSKALLAQKVARQSHNLKVVNSILTRGKFPLEQPVCNRRPSQIPAVAGGNSSPIFFKRRLTSRHWKGHTCQEWYLKAGSDLGKRSSLRKPAVTC